MEIDANDGVAGGPAARAVVPRQASINNVSGIHKTLCTMHESTSTNGDWSMRNFHTDEAEIVYCADDAPAEFRDLINEGGILDAVALNGGVTNSLNSAGMQLAILHCHDFPRPGDRTIRFQKVQPIQNSLEPWEFSKRPGDAQQMFSSLDYVMNKATQFRGTPLRHVKEQQESWQKLARNWPEPERDEAGDYIGFCAASQYCISHPQQWQSAQPSFMCQSKEEVKARIEATRKNRPKKQDESFYGSNRVIHVDSLDTIYRPGAMDAARANREAMQASLNGGVRSVRLDPEKEALRAAKEKPMLAVTEKINEALGKLKAKFNLILDGPLAQLKLQATNARRYLQTKTQKEQAAAALKRELDMWDVHEQRKQRVSGLVQADFDDCVAKTKMAMGNLRKMHRKSADVSSGKAFRVRAPDYDEVAKSMQHTVAEAMRALEEHDAGGCNAARVASVERLGEELEKISRGEVKRSVDTNAVCEGSSSGGSGSAGVARKGLKPPNSKKIKREDGNGGINPVEPFSSFGPAQTRRISVAPAVVYTRLDRLADVGRIVEGAAVQHCDNMTDSAILTTGLVQGDGAKRKVQIKWTSGAQIGKEKWVGLSYLSLVEERV